MPDSSTVALFTLAALALLLVPGPAVVYIVTRSVSQGRAAGLASVAGIHVGTAVHVAAAAAGVSAVLVSSAAAYNALRWAGAAYLIALGLRKLVSPGPGPGGDDGRAASPPQPLAAVFRQGVVVNVLNPKTALFFFAFLPQFVDPDRGAVVAQSFLLGALFIALGSLTDGCYALAGAALGGAIRRRPRVGRGFDRGSGLVYVALGALGLVAERPRAGA